MKIKSICKKLMALCLLLTITFNPFNAISAKAETHISKLLTSYHTTDTVTCTSHSDCVVLRYIRVEYWWCIYNDGYHYTKEIVESERHTTIN